MPLFNSCHTKKPVLFTDGFCLFLKKFDLFVFANRIYHKLPFFATAFLRLFSEKKHTLYKFMLTVDEAGKYAIKIMMMSIITICIWPLKW